MADVYSKARRTFIFLGPRGERSEEALNFFEEVGRELVGYETYGRIDHIDEHVGNVLSQCVREDPGLANLHGVDALIATVIEKGKNGDLLSFTDAIMSCTWWDRTWVSEP